MDVVEVPAPDRPRRSRRGTRNSRAFLQAFDLAPGALSGWSERTCARWQAWTRENDRAARRRRPAGGFPLRAGSEGREARRVTAGAGPRFGRFVASTGRGPPRFRAAKAGPFGVFLNPFPRGPLDFSPRAGRFFCRGPKGLTGAPPKKTRPWK